MPSTGHKKVSEKQRTTLRVQASLGKEQSASFWQLALALAILSCGALAYEILLTRLFSLAFQYHYAFLAVSLAILGLGLGGLLAQVFHTSIRGKGMRAWLSWLLVGYGLALPITAFLFSQLPSATSVVAHVLVGLIPFTLAGMVSAAVYAENSHSGAVLYAADLLGSAAGLLLITLLLGSLDAFQATFLLGLLPILAAMLVGFSPSLRSTAGVGASLLFVGLFFAGKANLDLPANFADAPPDKVMYHVLSDPSQSASLVDSAWSPFARVDLVKTNDPDQMYVFTDAGAGSFMIRFDGDLSQVSWIKEQPGYLPFSIGPVEHSLILGSGAGKDILQARLAGSPDITAVEINPAIISLTEKYASYNGNVLHLPGVKTVINDGRNFIARDPNQYNLIYLNLVYSQASEPGSAALSEAYIFTQEAFRLYWDHLTPNGRLAIVSHQALEGSRGLMTAIGSLQATGMKASEVLRRSALVMTPNDDPNQRVSVLILKKSPWTADELQKLRSEYESRGLQALYVPSIFETTLRGLNSDDISLDKFLATDPTYNLFPTSDDQPFFFNLYPGLPGPLKSLLWVIGLATVAYLGLVASWRLPGTQKQWSPILSSSQAAWGRIKERAWKLGYFGLLGMGFMFIEVPLIQRAILLLGNPTLALVVVIGGLLLSAGLGSLLSSRIDEENLLPWVAGAGVGIALLAALAAFYQPVLTSQLLSAGLTERALATGLILLPVGIPMGLPFSSGLRLAGRDEAAFVPALWGWNAITSVLGSVLATTIAMLAGFHWTLLAGAVCYLALSILVSIISLLSRSRGKSNT